MQIRGEREERWIQLCNKATKEGKRKRKMHPAMNSSFRDTPGGRKRKKKRKRRRQKTLPAMRLEYRDAPRRGDGVAAEVLELVVVEIHNLHYTPSVNGFDLCHPLSEDCCCQYMAASPCGYCNLMFFLRKTVALSIGLLWITLEV